MSEFASQHPWFVDALLCIFLATLVILLVWLVMKIIGEDVKLFIEYFKEEREDSKNHRHTIGSRNWKCVKLLFFFGLIAIASNTFTEVLTLIEKFIGKSEAESLKESINVPTLFYVLAIVMVISVLSVLASKKQN